MVNNLNAEALRNALVVASMEYCKKYLEGQKCSCGFDSRSGYN